MKINNLERKITALFFFGMWLLNVFITIPETEKSEALTSIDLHSVYGMPSSIMGMLHLTNFLFFVGIIYCLSNLDDKFKLFQKDEVKADEN